MSSALRSRQRGFLLNPARFASGTPTDSNTKLMLHGDGADASTVFTDSSVYARTLTAFGSAQLSTANAKYGSAAMDFSASGAYIANDSLASLMAFGTQDFCVEFWMKRASVTGDAVAVTTTIDGSAGGGWWINFQGNNLQFYNNAALILSATSVGSATGSHIHWAFSRQGTAFRAFKAGNIIATSTSTASISANVFRVGGARLGGFAAWILGYMDDLRITVGDAVYTSDFTPPSAALPDF